MKKNRVATFIVNYNMPERTDALHSVIKDFCYPHNDVFVIDNGSDIAPPSIHTNVRIDENVQTTNGWLLGLAHADALALKYGHDYFAYWFIITSAGIPLPHDVLTPLVEVLENEEKAVGVHPSLTQDSTTAWEHLMNSGRNIPRETWMIDNIASLWKADFFDAVGRFDPHLVYGWGIDLELSYLALESDHKIFVHDGVQVEKITNIGYKMDRMNMHSNEREVRARMNMNHILSAKYGEDWKLLLFKHREKFE